MSTDTAAAAGIRNYSIVTLAYWAFTLTDGAIRMLVVLYFYEQGYSALAIASLFLFYELFGVITNLIGGWLGARVGINSAMYLGMVIQIGALLMLAVDPQWLSVVYVMTAQALSGIAKDLNKMGAKSSLKLLLPEDAHSRLFKWVALLTGSKNALKGVGFFLGGLLLSLVGFRGALYVLSAGLSIVLVISMLLLPSGLGKAKGKTSIIHLFSKSPAINWLSAARLFLFGSRDVWFVVGLPVYLSSQLQWTYTEVGGFFALWVIGYGLVQALAPRLVRHSHKEAGPDGGTATMWAVTLLFTIGLLCLYVGLVEVAETGLIIGLILFAAVFAVNSSVHSYLILAYSSREQVAMDVGFYYMANAGGRLTGTILSGWSYQTWGLLGCLAVSLIFVALAGMFSLGLPRSRL